MALLHWATSIAHGIAAWLVLLVTERIASGGGEAQLLTSGTCAAIALVSTLPWAITLRLPRFSGGIGWLLALAISASVWPSSEFPLESTTDLERSLSSAWQVLVYPPGLVGHALSAREAIMAAPALVLACGSMVAACRWVSRASVPLEAAQ
jgi:hypothetical protein